MFINIYIHTSFNKLYLTNLQSAVFEAFSLDELVEVGIRKSVQIPRKYRRIIGVLGFRSATEFVHLRKHETYKNE